MAEYTSPHGTRHTDTRHELNALGTHRIDSTVSMLPLHVMYTVTGLWPKTSQTYDKHGVLNAVIFVHAI